MKHAAILIFLYSGTALAAEQPLTGPDIEAALTDRVVGGVDEKGQVWEQSFLKGGATYYSTGSSSNSQGRWQVRGDKYCSQWPPSDAWSCYAVTGEDDRITFISSTGTTYPAKLRPK